MKQSMAPVDFAAKLRLTAIALRCNSRKELCARFRAVNPATHCDVDRMHKWMQGRALPRSVQVLDDLAAVIGSARSGAWLGHCDLAAFVCELAATTGASEEELHRAIGPTDPAPPATAGIMGGLATLAGNYGCYSRAWSPHYQGRLVRGSLRLAPSPDGSLQAVYAETLAGKKVHARGPLTATGRVAHGLLLEPGGGLPLFLTLHVPGTPAAVMTGILAGITFLANDTLPAGSCIVAVRVGDRAPLDRTNRYLDPSPAAVADDLAALGLAAGIATAAGAEIANILHDPPQSAPITDQHRLAALLDPYWLE